MMEDKNWIVGPKIDESKKIKHELVDISNWSKQDIENYIKNLQPHSNITLKNSTK